MLSGSANHAALETKQEPYWLLGYSIPTDLEPTLDSPRLVGIACMPCICECRLNGAERMIGSVAA